MRLVLLVSLLAACAPQDPALSSRREALEAYERGVAQLEAEDPAAARASFESALRHRPRDPVLMSWLAKAKADAGDLEGAIDVSRSLLQTTPRFVEARYNLAAYLARADRPEEAAEELAIALQGPLDRRPRDVLDDPDFARWRDHEAFAGILPAEPLTVLLEVPDGSVFLGSEFPVRLRVLGAGEQPIGVTAESASGPVTLVDVVEDVVPSTEGPFRDITWRFRVTGAGPVELGPFHVWAGDRTARAEPARVEAVAPEGRGDADRASLEFTTPREIANQLEAPVARRRDQGFVVLVQPGDRVEVAPKPTTDPVRYELRDRGQPKWVLWHYPQGAATSEVRVVRSGATVWQGPPTTG